MLTYLTLMISVTNKFMYFVYSLYVLVCDFSNECYYAALLPRRGPHIASHSVCLSVCPSVCLSVCPSVPLSLPWVTSFRPR